MCLVFFTLYEQTYGSWVTFTDRMLTKDVCRRWCRYSPRWCGRGHRRQPGDLLPQRAVVDRLAAAGAGGVRGRRRRCRTAIRIRRCRSCCSVCRRSRCWCSCCATRVVLPQTAGSLTYLGALFIVLLAPLFGVLWAWLDRRGLDPSKPVKSALGLLLAGAEFHPARVGRAAGRRERRDWRACGGWCSRTSCSSSARCACRRSDCRR